MACTVGTARGPNVPPSIADGAPKIEGRLVEPRHASRLRSRGPPAPPRGRVLVDDYGAIPRYSRKLPEDWPTATGIPSLPTMKAASP